MRFPRILLATVTGGALNSGSGTESLVAGGGGGSAGTEQAQFGGINDSVPNAEGSGSPIAATGVHC